MQSKVAIIGAGPAGMAAAKTLAALNIHCTVLDEQPAPGGQIYRAVSEGGSQRVQVLGKEYLAGEKLTRGLQHQNITTQFGASVWGHLSILGRSWDMYSKVQQQPRTAQDRPKTAHLYPRHLYTAL